MMHQGSGGRGDPRQHPNSRGREGSPANFARQQGEASGSYLMGEPGWGRGSREPGRGAAPGTSLPR